MWLPANRSVQPPIGKITCRSLELPGRNRVYFLRLLFKRKKASRIVENTRLLYSEPMLQSRVKRSPFSIMERFGKCSSRQMRYSGRAMEYVSSSTPIDIMDWLFLRLCFFIGRRIVLKNELPSH